MTTIKFKCTVDYSATHTKKKNLELALEKINAQSIYVQHACRQQKE